MIEFNYNDEIVSSPTVIVSGRTTNYDRGVIQFINNNSKVFPVLHFEVNNSQFKALVHVSTNEANHFQVLFWAGASISASGQPVGMQSVADEANSRSTIILCPKINRCIYV